MVILICPGLKSGVSIPTSEFIYKSPPLISFVVSYSRRHFLCPRAFSVRPESGLYLVVLKSNCKYLGYSPLDCAIVLDCAIPIAPSRVSIYLFPSSLRPLLLLFFFSIKSQKKTANLNSSKWESTEDPRTRISSLDMLPDHRLPPPFLKLS